MEVIFALVGDFLLIAGLKLARSLPVGKTFQASRIKNFLILVLLAKKIGLMASAGIFALPDSALLFKIRSIKRRVL